MESTQESRPVTGNRAAEDLAEGSTTSVKPDRPSPAKPALIGAAVERALDGTVWDLVTGKIGLHDVTPAIAALYSVGFADGVASCGARIARLEHEADVLYVQAFNPSDRAKLIRKRMDAAAAEYEAEFMANGGDVK